MLNVKFYKPENRENAKDFEYLIIVLNTFSQGVDEGLYEILKLFNTRVGLFRDFIRSIEGVQHAAIF